MQQEVHVNKMAMEATDKVMENNVQLEPQGQLLNPDMEEVMKPQMGAMQAVMLTLQEEMELKFKKMMKHVDIRMVKFGQEMEEYVPIPGGHVIQNNARKKINMEANITIN